MDDLTMTKLCAEAMGESVHEYQGCLFFHGERYDADKRQRHYDPLHDDAQAMALEDWLIRRGTLIFRFGAMIFQPFGPDESFSANISNDDPKARRRAIVECVAKLQEVSRGA